MAKVQLFSQQGDLYPQTRADCVSTGAISLAERLNDDYFILKDTGTNQYKKVSLVNGEFVLEDYDMPFCGYRNFLALGNSITLHEIKSYWWGFWGMAATIRDNDWVHQLLAKLQQINPDCVEYALNMAQSFERDGVYDLTQIISNEIASGHTDFQSIVLSSIELVIIRVGENGLASQELVENLIDSIRTNCPNAEIVITGMFWTNATKEEYLRGAALAKNCSFVQIDQYNTPTYKSSVGSRVYGDDDQWHIIENSGVAAHPNDAGMLAIANAVYNSLERAR